MITCSMWLPLVGFLLLTAALETESYNILIVPLPQKSHLFSLKMVTEGLMTRGHRVHLLFNDMLPKSDIPYPDGDRFKIVLYHGKMPRFMAPDASQEEMFEAAARKTIDDESSLTLMTLARDVVRNECEQLLLNSEDTIRLLENEKFDIAVVDGNLLSHCLYLLPFRLRIPWVTYTEVMEPRLVPVPWLPSFVPFPIGDFSEKMDFKQRIQNTLAQLFLWSGYLNLDVSAEIFEVYRQYGHVDSLDDLARQSQLFLSTRDTVLEYARPTMPNIVNVGGLTTRPARNVSEDLQNFLNGSIHGAILVTFGSMTKTLPGKMAEKLLIAFGRLEGYRVLLKFENTDKLTIPGNVRIQSWVPQQDILGHPRTRLFITHCGNNGQYEAVYHGVPMIGFPLHSDEPYNAKRIEYKGYGISMNIHDFTADDLYNNIIKVTTNPSYKDRVSLASEIFRSAPQRPAERAAYWIEHVIKFGSDHLQSAGKDLNFFQYYLLDVLATIALVLVGAVFLAWKLGFWLCRKVLKRGRSDKLKTN